jgi:SAM-dependent methyltransferase
MKLNVGCGNKKIEGYIGVDKYKCKAAEYICDVEKNKLPFDDNTVTDIILDNVVEHFYDIPLVMNELIRVCKKGAIIKIITPHFSSLKSWIDPTHFHHLSFFSFDYYERKVVPHYVGKGIAIKNKKISFGGGFMGLTARFLFKINPKKYEQKYCFIFRASTLTFTLQVL